MALQDILKRILDEAATKVKAVEADIDQQKKGLAAKSAELEKEGLAKLEAKTASALSTLEIKTTAMARRENAKLLLAAKQEVIQTALDGLYRSLVDADNKAYSEMLEKLFAHLSIRSGKVLAPAKRLEVTTKVAPPGFDVVAHKDIEGGFILQSDGTEVDNSFRALIYSEFKDSLTQYFAEQLKLV